jgi:parvulin-like peptidyl-prolyl isomerase
LAKKKHKKHPSKKKSDNTMFKVVVFVILVAVVGLLIFLTSKSGSLRLTKQDRVAATVNGEEITTEYLDEQYARVPPEYQGFITKSMLLNQTINEVLLLQEAKKKGITVSKEDVQAEIAASMEQANVTEQELNERLAAQNVTRDFLEDLYMKQLTINKLIDEVVGSKIQVTDAEVKDFYDSRIRAMHILVETEDEAYDLIDQLKKVPLNAIESKFSELAKENSIDPSAETNGGDLGEFGRGMMVPEFEQAAFGLEEYAFTAEPVKTQYGYHIILRLPKEQTLDEQADAIREFLLTQKKGQAVPLYLDQLLRKADIQVFFKEEPQPAPAAPQIQVTSPAPEPVPAEQ